MTDHDDDGPAAGRLVFDPDNLQFPFDTGFAKANIEPKTGNYDHAGPHLLAAFDLGGTDPVYALPAATVPDFLAEATAQYGIIVRDQMAAAARSDDDPNWEMVEQLAQEGFATAATTAVAFLDAMLPDDTEHDIARRILFSTIHASIAGMLEAAFQAYTSGLTVKTCRICGCTDLRACAGGCTWIEDPLGAGPLCSSCLPDAQATWDRMCAAVDKVGSPPGWYAPPDDLAAELDIAADGDLAAQAEANGGPTE